MPADEMSPVDMLLFCPRCGSQHVDEPDTRTPDWSNPPHRSHLCHECGCIWRPADVPTNGVASIETKGKADTWLPDTQAMPADTRPSTPPDVVEPSYFGTPLSKMLATARTAPGHLGNSEIAWLADVIEQQRTAIAALSASGCVRVEGE